MEITGRSIEKLITLNCSINVLWEKWTTHAGLLTFFGRDNKIELAPGGAFEIYFITDNPYGLRGSEGCKVLSYLPGKMLSFSWNAPPELAEARDSGYYTWVVVNFVELSEGESRLELFHLGWPEGKIWEEVFDYFDNAWDSVLDWLNKSCNASK